MRLSKEQIGERITLLFEEESQEAKDFLERNFDEIVDELYRIETEEENICDFFQNEIEKYDEYLALE